MSKDPIVVTGMGLVTPLGVGVGPVWERLLAGESGIGPIDRFDAEGLATQIGGLVPDINDDPAGLDAAQFVSSKERRKIDLFTLYAIAAADEALAQSGWEPEEQAAKDRTAIIVGT